MAKLDAGNRERMEQLAAELAELGYPITLPPKTTVYEVWIDGPTGPLSYVGHYDGDPPAWLVKLDGRTLDDVPVADEVGADLARHLRTHTRIRDEQAMQLDPVTGEGYRSAVDRSTYTLRLITG